jgi:hypothetical protein
LCANATGDAATLAELAANAEVAITMLPTGPIGTQAARCQPDRCAHDRRAQWTGGLAQPNFDALMKVADQALYRCKERGRNQISMAVPEPSSGYQTAAE